MRIKTLLDLKCLSVELWRRKGHVKFFAKANNVCFAGIAIWHYTITITPKSLP